MDLNRRDRWDDECSVIGDKEEIGFIDFEGDKSVCAYDPKDGPILISFPFPFKRGKPQSIFIGETFVHSITIENTTSEPMELWGVNIYCSNPTDSFTLALLKPPLANSDVEYIQGFLEGFSLEDRVLQPRQTLTIWLSCKPKEIGLHTSIVHFDVDNERIERVVFLLAEDKISQSLASKKPYSRFPRRKPFGNNDYPVELTPPKRKTQGPNGKLPMFEIPMEIRELLENKQVPEVITEGLMKENYASFFNTLLNMEELHLEKEMRCHDMERVTMRRKGANLLALRVPGLAERRPSLVHGDFVFATLSSHNAHDPCPQNQGCIYRIKADEVLLKFSKQFHMLFRVEDLYNITFTYNRVNMRRLYRAVQEAGGLDKNLLFPCRSTKRLNKPTKIVPFTSVNEEQLRAIEMILSCEGVPPYVIHGPPGTGKTMTLVEAILQLYATRKNTRVLVCAASNSAADHILEKIVNSLAVGVKENEVFRLNATSRSYEDVQANNLRFCFFEGYIFKCPPFKALMQYKVIISTYMSSSLLYAEGICRGHFSHIFLDEAGQASEPETMVPISNFCQRETVVVLAGDPMQLGPVVYSNDTKNFGLGKSYLERLFECESYSSGDESFITKLVRNYRCHPSILHLPSKLFYGGKLLSCKEETTCLESWLSLLPNKEFHVLFHGIQGCDEREVNDPSWFNRIEASKVVDFVKKLRAGTGLREEDIGVIAPYRKQVNKITEALETFEMPDVKVGSVEQFQGQEREVIIVSTVRSTAKHNAFDKTYSLGFLSNPRRFNVAVTRARSLLIVVGNPHIVSKDPCWHKLLWHCSDNNSYQGCPLPERQPDLEDNLDYGGASQTFKEGNE